MTFFLYKDIEYEVAKTSYNRFIKYTTRDGYTSKGLLRIEPLQNVTITLISFLGNDEMEVIVDKYSDSKKHLSKTVGILEKRELLKLIGQD